MKQIVFKNRWNGISSDPISPTSDQMPEGSLPARRRFELIRLAQRQGQLSVAELSMQFGVSPDTIRRDLDLLSVRGLVRRIHGGAVPIDCLVKGSASSAQPMDLR